MNEYARINRACIIQAIGPQKNHYILHTIETDEIDRSKSGCFSCPYFHAMKMDFQDMMPDVIQEQIHSVCASCSHCVHKLKTVKKYINEKNTYGYGKRLSLVATKALIYYHSLGPDKAGIVKNINLDETARLLCCTKKSIQNANKSLSSNGYIDICNSGKGFFNVSIPTYRDNGKKANEGGRGYITINRKMMNELISVKSVLKLRVMLRVLLDSDTSDTGNISENINVFKRFLPMYCKPGIILKALMDTCFFVTYNKENAQDIDIHIEQSYRGRIGYHKAFQDAFDSLSKHMEFLKDKMHAANIKLLKHQNAEKEIAELEEYGFSPVHFSANNKILFVEFKTTTNDIRDMASVAASYSVSSVKNALQYIYRKYNKNFTEYKIGPLVRSIIKA